MIQGRVIGVKIDGKFYPCELNSSLDVSTEMISTSSKAKGYWEDYANGKKSWSINVDGRLNAMISWGSAFNKIMEKTIEGDNEFEVAFQMRSNPETDLFFRFWGNAKLSNANLSAPTTGYASGTYTFQGCGALNMEVLNIEDIIRAMEIPDQKDLVIDMS